MRKQEKVEGVFVLLFLLGAIGWAILIAGVTPKKHPQPKLTPQKIKEIKQSCRKESQSKHEQSFKSCMEDTLK